MGLKYVVITMVDRDDLEDFGAGHVYNVFSKIKELSPGIKIEFLGGDFNGSLESLRVVAKAQVDVFAHNIETIERLTPRVRDMRAGYLKSLKVLKEWKQIPKEYKSFTKSAIMLGLGETYDEVVKAMEDLLEHDVDFLTIGQYMRPTKKHLSVKEWVHPEVFERLEMKGKEMGFKGIVAKPLVRSSYKAREFYEENTRS
jgi:lipoic acid synthetase